MLNLIKKLFGGQPVDFASLVKEGAVIVDVRTKAEYQGGHIQQSKNIPLDTLATRIEELKKTNKPVITVCRSGGRSRIAASMLKSAGVPAYNGGPWNSLQQNIR